MKVKEKVFTVDNTPQLFESIAGLNVYESKKALFLRSHGLNNNSFEILIRVCNSWIYEGVGMTVYGLDKFYTGYNYTSIYKRLTVLCKHDLIECVTVNRFNTFIPTSKAISVLNELLLV